MAAAWLLARELPLVMAFGPVFRGAGLVMVLGGVALIGWSALWFWRKKTTIEPHHAPTNLIVEGPYRFSRNPIYLGMAAIMTGWVVWLGALGPILLPVAFVAIINRRFIRAEEASLIAAFGDEGRRYLQSTRRWL